MNPQRWGIYQSSREPRPAANAARRHRPDYQIVLFMGILLLLGLIVLYAISPARVEQINLGGYELDQAHFMQKQLIYLLIGLAGFGVAAAIPLAFWQKQATNILLSGFGLSVLLALLGLAGAGMVLCTNGACRWFDVGFGTFQPAELVKFGLLLFAAGFLGRRIQQNRVNDFEATLVPLGIILAVATVFIVGIQKDMGTGIAIAGILASMLFISGLKFRYLALGAIIAGLVGMLFIAFSPHRLERVATFLNSSENSQTTSYHITQAKIAIGSGGLVGKGLGNSVQAFGYLPEAVNDSIFAILGELFGFIGLLVILAIFFGLLLRMLKIMDHSVDPVYRLIVAGVFGWIATHAVVNIGAMLGVFPLTGVTLPMLSFGGTSLLFMMLGLGLVFQVSRYTTHQDLVKDNAERSRYANTRSWRGLGRPRYASSSRR